MRTNDKHVINIIFFIKWIQLENMYCSFSAFVAPLGENMCQCPREKGPLCPTRLFGVRGGEEQTIQRASARRSARGQVQWTPHVHKA